MSASPARTQAPYKTLAQIEEEFDRAEEERKLHKAIENRKRAEQGKRPLSPSPSASDLNGLITDALTSFKLLPGGPRTRCPSPPTNRASSPGHTRSSEFGMKPRVSSGELAPVNRLGKGDKRQPVGAGGAAAPDARARSKHRNRNLGSQHGMALRSHVNN